MAETPHTHPFGAVRPPPGLAMAAAQPRGDKYTQSQIAEALIGVASGILHTRLNRAMALNVAAVIGVYVNDPNNRNFQPGGNLDGNPAFNALVSEKAPLLLLAMADPEAAKAQAQAEVARHNFSGAPLSETTMATLGLGRRYTALDSATSEARSTSAAATFEKTGITGKDFAALESRYGGQALGVALGQAEMLGMRGQANVALLLEHKDVAAAVTSGDMAKAWAIYYAEKDPQRQREILKIIQAGIEAQNKNSKQLSDAIKDKPKTEQDEIRKRVEAFVKNSENPKARADFEALQKKYESDKAVSKVLRETKENNEQLAKAVKEKAEKNKGQEVKNKGQEVKNKGQQTANVQTEARVEVKAEDQTKKKATLAASFSSLNTPKPKDEVVPDRPATAPAKQTQVSAPKPSG